MSTVLIVPESSVFTLSCMPPPPPVASRGVTRRYRALAADFPARLRAARIGAGLTGAQLGEQVGLSKQGISGLERGSQGCTTLLCERLASALGLPPAQLGYGLAEAGGSAAGYGDRIKEARDERSMESVAQRLGFRDRSSIAHLEAERQKLDLALAELIARELGVRVPWLAFGVGEKK